MLPESDLNELLPAAAEESYFKVGEEIPLLFL
jgi:hypothetical protein